MMIYRIGFDGVATAEVARLLHAVEGRLNQHGILRAQGGGAGESTAGSLSNKTTECPPGTVCNNGKSGGDQPHYVMELIAAVVIAFFVGVIVGVQIGKRSAPAAR